MDKTVIIVLASIIIILIGISFFAYRQYNHLTSTVGWLVTEVQLIKYSLSTPKGEKPVQPEFTPEELDKELQECEKEE